VPRTTAARHSRRSAQRRIECPQEERRRALELRAQTLGGWGNGSERLLGIVAAPEVGWRDRPEQLQPAGSCVDPRDARRRPELQPGPRLDDLAATVHRGDPEAPRLEHRDRQGLVVTGRQRAGRIAERLAA
jgi:hypothetical protein